MSEPQDDGLIIPTDYVSHIFDISGRVAVITGGASGLGRAIAIGYAQAGAQVVLVDINDDGLQETAALIAGQGDAAHSEHVDVTKKSEVDALADRVVERYRPRRHPRQQRRRSLPLAGRGVPQGSLRLHRRAEPEGHVPVLPGLRAEDACAGQGQHREPGVHRLLHRLPLGERVSGLQGRRPRIDPCDGPRVAGPGRARQRHRPDPDGFAHDNEGRAAHVAHRRLDQGADAAPADGPAQGVIGAAIFLASDASELVTGHTLMCDDGYLTA